MLVNFIDKLFQITNNPSPIGRKFHPKLSKVQAFDFLKSSSVYIETNGEFCRTSECGDVSHESVTQARCVCILNIYLRMWALKL